MCIKVNTQMFILDMDIKEVINKIEYETRKKVSYKDIANAIGLQPSAIGNRVKRNGKATLDELLKLEKHFCVKLSNFSVQNEECITIERIHINPSCGSGTVVMGEAEVTPVLLGKKLLQNIFRVSNIEALKVFTATGDSMEDTIYDGDDVLVDTSCDNYTNGGVFVIEKFGEWFIKRLRLKFDGSLEIISDNTRKYQPEVVTLDSGIDINIKGKVIKNLSRGL